MAIDVKGDWVRLLSITVLGRVFTDLPSGITR
jgi:hypothetical protein